MISNEQRLKFLNDLEVPQPVSRREIMAGRAPEGTAAVVNSSDICFMPGMSEMHKADVMNSTLLAQLVANKKHDRTKDAEAWYRMYGTVLENLGWSLTGFQTQKVANPASYGSVDQIVLAVMDGCLSAQAHKLLQASIECLKNPSNSKAMKIMDCQSHNAGRADFQVGVCSESNGNVLFRICCCNYQTTGHINNVMFYRCGSDSMSCAQGNQKMELNERAYACVRMQVLEKLGGYVQAFIDELELC